MKKVIYPITFGILIISGLVMGCLQRVVMYGTTGVRSIMYRNPVFSPYGDAILVEAKRDLVLIRPDGTLIANLTEGVGFNDNARWSPDGWWIVFSSTRDGQADIYRIRPDGTELTNLTNTPTEDEDHPVYSPDGTRLIFSRSTIKEHKKTRHPDGSYYEWNETLNTHLVIGNADGTGQRILAPDGWQAWWSQDSRWIAYLDKNGGGIWIQSLDGTQKHKLVDGRLIAWTPDGKAIFYRPPRKGTDKNADVRRINVDGTGDRLVLKDYSVGEWWPGDPQRLWNPTGSLLALVVYREIGVRDGGVVIVDRDGNIISDFREQRSGFDYDPTASWSADGNWVLFRKYFGDPRIGWKGGVYMVNVRSGQERQVIADIVQFTKTIP
jgi:Tol biopolymer transport system component